MKFDWEKIFENGQDSKNFFYAVVTRRAKVHGGCVVRTFDSLGIHSRTNTTQSMVFVPDPNHEWDIKEELS